MRTIAVALAVALVTAGSSTAAFIVTSANIKNGTIKMVDISPAAKAALRGQRGTRGLAGQPGQPGPAGSQGPQGIQRLAPVISPEVVIQPGSLGTAEATCPAGEIAVSGGYALSGPDAHVYQSTGVFSGWVAKADNPSDAPDPATVRAYAYCSPNIVAG
jgi:hypothetical protein